LENAAKVPADTGGSIRSQEVLSGVLTMVDQKGSLWFVGDVFEVLAQVDRRLTKVNAVDRIIRVN
jgi:muramoyltetrapeptide carboxypeptidase LdcA involved in peptidoglycan recycling